MNELLEKATKFGQLIKESDLSQIFEIKKKQLEKNSTSQSLYQSYVDMGTSLENRKRAGDQIYDYEYEEYRELVEVVSNDQLILDYFKAHEEYMKLLNNVQEKLQ